MVNLEEVRGDAGERDMDKPSRTHAEPTAVRAEPAARSEVADRIERARRQLPVSAPDREPGDSRWQNWYSR
jgi:hypothetical protein